MHRVKGDVVYRKRELEAKISVRLITIQSRDRVLTRDLISGVGRMSCESQRRDRERVESRAQRD